VENVECIEPSSIKFDFLGKDSVPYENTVEVKPPVFRNVRRWIRKDAGGASASYAPP
jgi:DNA topoisomerase-1